MAPRPTATPSPPALPTPSRSPTASTLWQGLGRKVYEVVAAHRPCLPEPATGTPATPVPGGLSAAHARRLHIAVHELLEQGMALRAIARHLELDRNAVRRYARAPTWQQAAPTWPKRTGIIAPYQSFLHRRWAEGQHNIAALHREIAGQGFSGSEGTVRLYATDHQEVLDLGLPLPALERSPFEVSRLLMTRPERLDDDQRVFLKSLHGRCPELKTVHERIGTFADVFASQNTKRLDNWISQVRRDGIPQLVSYTNGLLNDLDTALAGRGISAADALSGSIALAELAEKRGFTRYWVTEHHSMPGVSSSSPAVLLARLTAHTTRLRLGAGGVMLPNHPPH